HFALLLFRHHSRHLLVERTFRSLATADLNPRSRSPLRLHGGHALPRHLSKPCYAPGRSRRHHAQIASASFRALALAEQLDVRLQVLLDSTNPLLQWAIAILWHGRRDRRHVRSQ